MKTSWIAIALAAATWLPLATHAADEATDAIQAAYAPYRAALFRTNSGAQRESEQALASSRKAWQEVMQRYARSVPSPYDRDPSFGPTLAKVDAVYTRAQGMVEAGKLADAHEALEEVRDLLAHLRARNGVITFSDHMNAYHAEMEEVLQQGPRALQEPGGTTQLLEQVAVLGYLANRLREAAPAALAEDTEFVAMHKAVDGSVTALRTALRRQDIEAARKALEALKQPYSRMFLKFG